MFERLVLDFLIANEELFEISYFIRNNVVRMEFVEWGALFVKVGCIFIFEGSSF